WTVGALAVSDQATLMLVTSVDQPGALVNQAAVTGQDQVDPNPLDDNGAASVNADPDADLRVGVAVSNPAPAVGSLITYTIAVTNLGPSPADNAAIHDSMPAGVAFVSATTSQGTFDQATGTWTLGVIPVTETETLSIVARVTASGRLTNTAVRQSSSPVDPNAANDTATSSATSATLADLAATITPGATTVDPGATLAWGLVAPNPGPADVAGANVAASLAAPFTAAAWTCGATPGSSCAAASGVGSISTTVVLIQGGRATFGVTGSVTASATGMLVATASIAAPAGVM